MSVFALETTSSLSGYSGYVPQYSQSEVGGYHSVLPIRPPVGEMGSGFNSTSNERSFSFYESMDEHDLVEDVQLKSFAKSSTKVKIKVAKVERIGISV